MSAMNAKKLRSLCRKFRSGGTPPSENMQYYGGSIPFVTIEDMTNSKRFVESTKKTLTPEGLRNSSCWLVPKKAVLYSIYATLGLPRINFREVATNQAILAMIPDETQLTPEFLFYHLSSIQPFVVRYASQTTQSNLNAAIVSDFDIPTFSLEIQNGITNVLGAIDRAIEQTEALIAKYQRIKTGLMQDLLTRGIDEHGRLRDPATHKFKPSPLGKIPDEWDVKPLAECVKEQITYGIVQAGPHIPGGVPYIRTGDMDGEELVRERMLCTSRIIADRYKRSEVKAGEIVCAIRATIGKVLPVPDDLDGANLTQGTARISPKESVHSRFLLWAMRSAKTQQEISLQSKGTTFAEITLTDLRRTPVAVPKSFDEQKHIALSLDTSDGMIAEETTGLSKLQRIKTGLMQDLLTGKVSVEPLLGTQTAA